MLRTGRNTSIPRGGEVVTSGQNLGLTQPHVERMTRYLFPGVKRPVREADHSPPSSAEVRFDSPIRLHGLVLN
jgi:hypothetical protein